MGNCVSLHKNTDMKLAVQIHSPNKENTVKSCGDKPQTSEVEQVASVRNPDSKDEIFFDSHLWLDSDCEDYFSVNGDLTPSRGSTPVHQKSFIEAPQLDKIHHTSRAPDSLPPSSPTDMKKQLIDLFRESFNDDPAGGNQNLQSLRETKPTILDRGQKSTSRSSYELQPKSLSSSETTPYRGSHNRKENSAQSAQCCIPSFMRSMSFSERKKRLSPSNTNGWYYNFDRFPKLAGPVEDTYDRSRYHKFLRKSKKLVNGVPEGSLGRLNLRITSLSISIKGMLEFQVSEFDCMASRCRGFVKRSKMKGEGQEIERLNSN